VKKVAPMTVEAWYLMWRRNSETMRLSGLSRLIENYVLLCHVEANGKRKLESIKWQMSLVESMRKYGFVADTPV
jgi:hypothetical protein